MGQEAGTPAKVMSAGGVTRLEGLPTNVVIVLTNFLDEARGALGDELVSAVLFGSAAEARLTPSSDVNLILVLRGFDAEKLVALSDPLLAAEAAIQLQVIAFVTPPAAAGSPRRGRTGRAGGATPRRVRR